MNIELFNSIICNTDSYKFSHWLQYPDISYMNSYIESRGGRWHRILFYGLQAFLREYMIKPFTKEHIDFADEFVTKHGLPFNKEGWLYILNKHGGLLPLKIEAVCEG